MLLPLITFGVVPEGGGSSGPITAPPEQIAVVPSVQGATSVATGAPLGVATWARPFDPGDHRPYAIDFTTQLRDGEEIAAMEEIEMSAAGALLGVGIDTATGYSPIIGDDGKMVQVYFAVEPEFWDELSFAASGLRLPVTFRVRTDGTPYDTIERSALLTVRQQ